MAQTIEPQQLGEGRSLAFRGYPRVLQLEYENGHFAHVEDIVQRALERKNEKPLGIRTTFTEDVVVDIAKFVKMLVDRLHPGETSLSSWTDFFQSEDVDSTEILLHKIKASFESVDGYREVYDLLESHFQAMKEEATRTGISDSPLDGADGSHDWTMQSTAIRGAFNTTTYRDNVNFVDNCLDHLHKCHSSALHTESEKSQILRIIQASGSGKSRGVYELARKLFVIPLDLGSDLPGDQTYPPPDINVRNRLDGMDYKWSHYYFAAFLQALVKETIDVINSSWTSNSSVEQSIQQERSLKESPSQTQISVEYPRDVPLKKSAKNLLKSYVDNTAERFRLYMTVGRDKTQGVLRREFYNRVLQQAEICFWEWKWEYSSPLDAVPADSAVPIIPHHATHAALREAAMKLCKQVVPTSDRGGLLYGKPRVLIAIDHAYESPLNWIQKYSFLDKTQGNVEHKWRPADSLEEALKGFMNTAVWTAYVGFMHAIPNEDGQREHPPFHNWDLSAAPNTPEPSKLEDLSAICSRLQFGHLQWMQYYEFLKVLDNGPAVVNLPVPPGFTNLVQSKLIPAGTDMKQTCFASMSQRIALRYNPRRTRLDNRKDNRWGSTTEQIIYHLRTVLGFYTFGENNSGSDVSTWERARTESLPDPLLADIVAYHWSQNDTVVPQYLLQVLEADPTIDPGDHGELVLACLMIDALDTERFDQAKVAEDPNYPIPSPVMNVTTFLKRLFSRNFYEEGVAKVAPVSNLHAGVNPKTLEETFFASRMMVTHFFRRDGKSPSLELLGESDTAMEPESLTERELSAEVLLRCIPRGEAILSLRNDTEPDLVIPFLLDGNILEVKNVSAILIKGVTNAIDIASGWDALHETSRKLFPQHGHPTIHVLYDLSNPNSAQVSTAQITFDKDPICAYRVQSNYLTFSGASAAATPESGTSQAYWELLQKCTESNVAGGEWDIGDVEYLRPPPGIAPSSAGSSSSEDGSDAEGSDEEI